MNRVFRNIANLSIAMILVLATGGFTVFQHYCACEKVVISSVLMEAVCVHDEVNDESCCLSIPQVRDCCTGVPEPESHPNACHHAHDCCQTSVSFFKTYDYFTPAKQENKTIISVLTVVLRPELITEPAFEPDQVVYNDTSPSFPAVKLFLKYHQRKDIPDLA